MTSPGVGLALLDAQQHTAADHEFGELLDRQVSAVVRVADHLAAAHHRNARR
ncbi:hypothetical protein [Ensifer canadensis]